MTFSAQIAVWKISVSAFLQQLPLFNLSIVPDGVYPPPDTESSMGIQGSSGTDSLYPLTNSNMKGGKKQTLLGLY